MRTYLLSIDSSQKSNVCMTEASPLQWSGRRQIDVIPIYKHSNRESLSNYSRMLRETNQSSEKLPRILRI
jgi:hypothetical protein